MARIRVRARAVDMLGRQQIAGIPTAIHELFKNAHDAFACHVEVDYFRSEDLLVLRDDGFGMTLEEFESRWLTLGTESKLGHREVRAEWMGEFGRKGRHVLGEKGIGRLAIAAIGPQVLVLTRVLATLGIRRINQGLRVSASRVEGSGKKNRKGRAAAVVGAYFSLVAFLPLREIHEG